MSPEETKQLAEQAALIANAFHKPPPNLEVEYLVTTKDASDWDSLWDDLTTTSTCDCVPSRPVTCLNERDNAPHTAHFALNESEAELLRADPRIASVEIAFHLQDDIKAVPCIVRDGPFNSSVSSTTADMKNWGLIQSSSKVRRFTKTETNTTRPAIGYYDGTGVDIVLIDSGIEPDHPEFAVNADGTGGSRVVDIDWNALSPLYSGLDITASRKEVSGYLYDPDGHGSNCASIAAGNTQGFAPKAAIYSIRAIGSDQTGHNYQSTDGVTWADMSTINSFDTSFKVGQARDIAWSGSVYVAVGSSVNGAKSFCFSSTDGITWTARPGLAAAIGDVGIYTVTYAAGVFMAFNLVGKCATSTDGITWTERTSFNSVLGSGIAQAAASSPSLTVAVGFSLTGPAGRALSSPDGITWTDRPGLNAIFGAELPVDIIWAGGQFVVIGGSLNNVKCATSPDGVTWTSRDLATAMTASGSSWPPRSITHDGTQYVVVGFFGRCATSPDGITWTAQSGLATPSLSATIYSVEWNGTKFLAVSAYGKVFSSTNAVTWTEVTTWEPLSLTGTMTGNIKWLNGKFHMLISSRATLNILRAFEMVTAFHQAKIAAGNTRPTICSNSWVFTGSYAGMTSTTYRGTTYTITTRNPAYGQVNDNRVASNTDVDISIAACAASGVIITAAAGNYRHKIDVSGGLDYNNTFNVGATVNYYHRGGTPNASAGVICVGAAAPTQTSADGLTDIDVEAKAYFSETGPRVDIYAPGRMIMGAYTNKTYTTAAVADTRNTSYYLNKVSGTSQACPHVTGVLACLKQKFPTYTSTQLLTLLTTNARNGALDEDAAAGTGYENFFNLQGGANKYLYQLLNNDYKGSLS